MTKHITRWARYVAAFAPLAALNLWADSSGLQLAFIGFALSALAPALGSLLGNQAGGGPGTKGGALGGVLGGLGGSLLDTAFGSFMDLVDGGSSGPGVADDAMLDDLNKVREQGYYTGSGFIGPEAQREARQSSRTNLGISSGDSIRSQAEQRGLAGNMLSGAQRGVNAAMENQARQAGQTRREGFGAVRSAGGGVANIAGTAGNIARANADAASGLGTQAAQTYMQGAAGASDAMAKAEAIRNQDLDMRRTIHIERSMRPDPQAASLYGDALGQANQQYSNQQRLMEDRYAMPRAISGMALGGQMANWQGYDTQPEKNFIFAGQPQQQPKPAAPLAPLQIQDPNAAALWYQGNVTNSPLNFYG